MPKAVEVEGYRLAESVPVSTAKAAATAIQEAKPIDQWTWQVKSTSGKEYTCGLWYAATGWVGYCTCTAFRMNVSRAKENQPVKPCKHLVALKSRHVESPQALELKPEPDKAAGGAEKPERKEVTPEPVPVAEETTAKEPAPPAVIPQAGGGLPIEADPEAAARAMQQFEAVKRAIVTREDVVKSQGKEYIRRSGFRKIALAYRISTQLLERRWERAGDAVIAYAAYRAVAPNGRFADGEGWCSLDEANVKRLAGSKGMAGKQYHVAAAIAATRAINRAIADLIGGGQVSAEEVDAEYYEEG